MWDWSRFGWKGTAQPPGVVVQPSDYLTSVPVQRTDPRLARVQRGLLVYTERSPHKRESVVLPFLLPCYIQTATRQRLILTRSPRNPDLFRYFGGGGQSHRMRTNLSFSALCRILKPRICCPLEALCRMLLYVVPLEGCTQNPL